MRVSATVALPVWTANHTDHEPDELPGCSTPRWWVLAFWQAERGGFSGLAATYSSGAACGSTIGAEGFHGRGRGGIGCLAPRHGHQAGEAGRREARTRPH